jgi:hypothetical protein
MAFSRLYLFYIWEYSILFLSIVILIIWEYLYFSIRKIFRYI